MKRLQFFCSLASRISGKGAIEVGKNRIPGQPTQDRISRRLEDPKPNFAAWTLRFPDKTPGPARRVNFDLGSNWESQDVVRTEASRRSKKRQKAS